MDRFWKKVERSGGCWNWLGYRDRDGYGRVGINGKVLGAHRVAYELMIGPVPSGAELDHLCRNRHCVNPAHLEAVTHKENMLRGAGVGSENAAKDRCVKGHLFDEKNTYLRPIGGRNCRACGRDAAQKYNSHRRAA